MKNTMRCFSIIALVAVIGFTFVSCPTDSPPPPSDPDIIVLDIRGTREEIEWDYLVVGKDGSSAVFNADESKGVPTSLYLKPQKDSDVGFTVLFKENGLPDTMIVDDYIFYYGNFNGYQFDLAIIKPDGTIAYEYGIETDVNYSAIAVSATDGINWTAVADRPFTSLNDDVSGIAYGSGRFVAGTIYGRTAYSADGISWTAISSRPLSSSGITDIAYGGGRFVAVGSSGGIQYSNLLDGGGGGTEANPFPLTSGVWTDGSVTKGGAVWYSFNVTSGITYYAWWNDYYEGDETKTGDVKVNVYLSNMTSIFTNEDSGWESPQSFTASTSPVRIKVEPCNSGDFGTFAVGVQHQQHKAVG